MRQHIHNFLAISLQQFNFHLYKWAHSYTRNRLVTKSGRMLNFQFGDVYRIKN